jgi:hypothetical protein
MDREQEDPGALADDMEREADELEDRSEELGDEVDEVRKDWEPSDQIRTCRGPTPRTTTTSRLLGKGVTCRPTGKRATIRTGSFLVAAREAPRGT